MDHPCGDCRQRQNLGAVPTELGSGRFPRADFLRKSSRRGLVWRDGLDGVTCGVLPKLADIDGKDVELSGSIAHDIAC
jgi:hypothetical protein